MGKVIEFYVRSKKVPEQADFSSFSSDHAACRGVIYKEESYTKFKTMRMITSSDEGVLEKLKEIAKDKGYILKVYDVSTLKGRLKAFRKGIKQTPTIVTETHRIVGVPKEEELQTM